MENQAVSSKFTQSGENYEPYVMKQRTYDSCVLYWNALGIISESKQKAENQNLTNED